jgi:hypothetical protein
LCLCWWCGCCKIDQITVQLVLEQYEKLICRSGSMLIKLKFLSCTLVGVWLTMVDLWNIKSKRTKIMWHLVLQHDCKGIPSDSDSRCKNFWKGAIRDTSTTVIIGIFWIVICHKSFRGCVGVIVQQVVDIITENKLPTKIINVKSLIVVYLLSYSPCKVIYQSCIKISSWNFNDSSWKIQWNSKPLKFTKIFTTLL